jgi:hypothetical protein
MFYFKVIEGHGKKGETFDKNNCASINDSGDDANGN